MTPEKQTATIRWMLAIIVVLVAGSSFGTWQPSLIGWVLIATLIILSALTQNLGIKTSFGEATFMPVTALMAYLALGREASLTVIVAGLLAGGGVQLARQWRRLRIRKVAWWIRLAEPLAPMAHNGLSLLAADWAYRVLGATPPLVRLSGRQEILAVLISPFIYLITYNLLLLIDLWLQGLSPGQQIKQNWRTVLAIEVLPLALAPLSAVTLASLGLWAFFLFGFILLTLMVVVNILMISQESLGRQIAQLNSFAAMNRALRTTLDKGALLEAVYLQTANILQIRNLHVILKSAADGPTGWTLSLAIEDRRIVQREASYRMDGFTDWVLRERQPLLADAVQQTARRLKIGNPPSGRCWMGVPLLAAGRVLGCMYTWFNEDEQPDRTFSQMDLDLFNAVAAQTGMALDNAYLYEATQQHATQLARLNQISTVMNASLNPEKVLELITEAVVEMTGCDRAAIYLLQSDGQENSLILAHAQGFSAEHIIRSREIAVPMSEAEHRRVLEEGETVAVVDIHAADAEVSPAVLLLARQENFAAYAYLPLRSQKQSTGMLAIYYNQPHHFTQAEVEMLETFANQAALAIGNASVFQSVDVQLVQQVEQVKRMAEINQRLSATLDMQTIFGLIIDSAMDGCHADVGVLVLSGDVLDVAGSSNELNMVAWRGFDPEKTTRMPHHVAEGVARGVLQSGQTVMTSLDDPAAPGPRSQLCVPITLDERVIGALALETERLNAFTEADLTFVGQLGLLAAVAIRNAQLYSHAQAVRDRLHAILDSSDDGLVMLDPRARIVMTNARMGDFWDFARRDFEPRTPEQFQADPLSVLGEGLGYIGGQLSDLLGRCIRNPNMTSETDLYEVHASAGQRPRFVERTSTPVRDDDGNFIGLLLIFRDMTQQKELEQAREELSHLIVHDLRAPLQAIMGGMKLINQFLPQKGPELEQATDISERSAKKLLNLVNDLLDISSMESGKVTLHTSIEDIGAIMQDAVQSVTALAEESVARVSVEVELDLPYVDIDRDMIERVVLNLVDNAVKHTAQDTSVRLRAACQPTGDPSSGMDMLRVEVADNGPGIPDDYKERIFDRFTKIPGQKSRRRSTGLGLTFCRLAVQAHGGKIWVEDNPGGGSVFVFTLPVAHIPPEASDETDSEIRPKSARKPRPAPAPSQMDEDSE